VTLAEGKLAAEFDRKNAIRGGGSPLQAAARGDAELGFTQISEVIAAPEVELVGPLEFAGSPTAIAVLRSKGLE
jgi:hypothetical protein